MSRFTVGALVLLLAPVPLLAGAWSPVGIPGGLDVGLAAFDAAPVRRFFLATAPLALPGLPARDGRTRLREQIDAGTGVNTDGASTNVGGIDGAVDGSPPVVGTGTAGPAIPTTIPTDTPTSTTPTTTTGTTTFSDPPGVISTSTDPDPTTTTTTTTTDAVPGAVDLAEATGIADAMDTLMKAGATRGQDNAALSILYKELRDASKFPRLHPARIRARLEAAGLSGTVLQQILNPLLFTSKNRLEEAWGEPPDDGTEDAAVEEADVATED